MKKIGFISFVKDYDYSIYYDGSDRYNKYRIVRTWRTSDGSKHTKTMCKYGDLLSCVEALRCIASVRNEDSR